MVCRCRGTSGSAQRVGAVAAAVVFLAAVALAPAARAGSALIAVASNFSGPIDQLKPVFERRTGHRLRVTFGSSGKLYAQIVAGAPFDAFLSADQPRPARLVADGQALAESRFTYATGKLTLWSADETHPGDTLRAALTAGRTKTIAIANPALAPYGQAAREVLQSTGLADTVASRLVMGQNIGQTYALIATGNASIGFVASAQLAGGARGGGQWPVPVELHRPIRQDAVLLQHGATNPAARAFLAFLQSMDAREMISRLGYEVATSKG